MTTTTTTYDELLNELEHLREREAHCQQRVLNLRTCLGMELARGTLKGDAQARGAAAMGREFELAVQMGERPLPG